MKRGAYADRVREHARANYVEPARRRGDPTIQIIAGDVEKAVHLQNRSSLVCQALRSHKFQEESRVLLEKVDGPPSGVSTTVVFTYRLVGTGGESTHPKNADVFLRLRGSLKNVFQKLGGGEQFIRRERQDFHGSRDS